MRYLIVMVVFLLFSVSADASGYARSIRVGSFKYKSTAQKAVEELNKFIAQNERLLEIKYELGFKVKVKKAGRHYLTVLEPLTNKQMVQETLDILRTKYPGTYPKRIKYKSYYATLGHKGDAQEQQFEAPQQPKEPIVNPQEKRKQISKKIDEMFAAKKEEVTSKSLPKKELEHKEVQKKQQKVDEDALLEAKIQQKLAAMRKAKEDEFKIFGVGLGFSASVFDDFDFFGLLPKTHQEEKKKELHDFLDGKLTKFDSYMLEIEILTGVLVFLIFVAVVLKYRRKKDDKITIQDIYN